MASAMSIPKTFPLLVVTGTVALLVPLVASPAYPIAGLRPDQRPQGAPSITEVKKNSGWYRGALRGITEPIPSSLRFLEDQGNWYTPFDRPGMLGRYDIRGWHGEVLDTSTKVKK